MYPRISMCLLGLVLCACGSSGGGFAPAADGGPPITEFVQVTTLANDGPGSLRQVVADALPGAQVTFAPGIVGGLVSLQSQIMIDKPVRISGGAEGVETEIFLDGFDRAFFIGSVFARLEGLRLIGCDTPGVGGAIFVGVDAHVVLSRVQIVGAEAGLTGGGLHAAGATLRLDRCNVSGCNGGHGGGLYLLTCDTLVTNSSFTFNWTTGGPGGGIMAAGGALIARSSTLHGNHATAGTADDIGGGICALATAGGCDLGLYGCTLTANEAMDGGGGLYLDSNGDLGEMAIRQTIIADNVSPGPDLNASIAWSTTSAYNLIGIGGLGPISHGVNGNMVGSAAMPLGALLGPLEVASYPTHSRMPLLGSFVNNAVPHDQCLDESGLPMFVDQRLESRFGDGNADIGAVEFNP